MLYKAASECLFQVDVLEARKMGTGLYQPKVVQGRTGRKQATGSWELKELIDDN